MVLCFDIRARERGVRGQVEVHIQRSAVSLHPLNHPQWSLSPPPLFLPLPRCGEYGCHLKKDIPWDLCSSRPPPPAQPVGSERQAALPLTHLLYIHAEHHAKVLEVLGKGESGRLSVGEAIDSVIRMCTAEVTSCWKGYGKGPFKCLLRTCFRIPVCPRAQDEGVLMDASDTGQEWGQCLRGNWFVDSI